MARITVSRQGYCHADLMNFRQRRAPFRFNRNGKGSSPVYGEQRRGILLSLGVDQPSFARDRLAVVHEGQHIAQSRATIGRGLNPKFVELPSGPELRDQPAWMSSAACPGLGRLRGIPILRKQGSARHLPGRMMQDTHAELAQSLIEQGLLG